jgi:hypothetical protein
MFSSISHPAISNPSPVPSSILEYLDFTIGSEEEATGSGGGIGESGHFEHPRRAPVPPTVSRTRPSADGEREGYFNFERFGWGVSEVCPSLLTPNVC